MKRHTVQKEIICRTVRTMTDHPSSEEVYDEIHSQHPSIGRATVYRTLNAMAEEGSIRKVSLPDTACRFDCRMDDHIHFRCVKCNRVFDMDFDGSGGMLKQIGDLTGSDIGGFDIRSASFSLEGLCRECREDKK